MWDYHYLNIWVMAWTACWRPAQAAVRSTILHQPHLQGTPTKYLKPVKGQICVCKIVDMVMYLCNEKNGKWYKQIFKMAPLSEIEWCNVVCIVLRIQNIVIWLSKLIYKCVTYEMGRHARFCLHAHQSWEQKSISLLIHSYRNRKSSNNNINYI